MIMTTFLYNRLFLASDTIFRVLLATGKTKDADSADIKQLADTLNSNASNEEKTNFLIEYLLAQRSVLLDAAKTLLFVLVIFLIAARKILFSLFTNDETVIQIGCEMLVLITPWYIVYVFIEVLAGALRGVGDVIVPVIITLLGICVMRIAWLIGVLKISPTISAIIFSYPVTWLLTALFFIGYYLYKQKKFS